MTMNMTNGYEASRTQAFEQGITAAAEGKTAESNPYAMEMEWNGKTSCPTADQRDEWNRGYNL